MTFAGDMALTIVTRAILHNEKTYPEPEVFRPERFLNEDGSINPDVPDPIVSFGFGRRFVGSFCTLRLGFIVVQHLSWASPCHQRCTNHGCVDSRCFQYRHTNQRGLCGHYSSGGTGYDLRSDLVCNYSKSLKAIILICVLVSPCPSVAVLN